MNENLEEKQNYEKEEEKVIEVVKDALNVLVKE